MILTLPFPPSSNGLFKNRRGGRTATDKYKSWQEEAGYMLKQQCCDYRTDHQWVLFSGPVAISLHFTRPDKRKRDLDNLLKAPIDLLVKCNVIGDDRQVEKIEASWSQDTPGVGIVVSKA